MKILFMRKKKTNIKEITNRTSLYRVGIENVPLAWS